MLTDRELQAALKRVNEKIDRIKGEWEQGQIKRPMNLSPHELARLRTKRALQGDDLIWERLLGPRKTSPRPPEWGLDREAIELAQAGGAYMLNAMGKGSVHMARSDGRQSYRYQSRNPEKAAVGHGVEYLTARIVYGKIMREKYGI